MRRARSRWLPGLLAGTLLICIFELMGLTDGLKATSLIHSKGTTTTAKPVEEEPSESEDYGVTAEGGDDEASRNATSKMTGIPQLDYVHDPNLPRELNGHNLSDYPFYGTVPAPELITFKCNGLHDGFYASVEHKCQIYHHCIYGVRHDFLCANYTAFDQRTFICHFVSEVDCPNSPKFWNRNDNLYMATTTPAPPTTLPPPTTAPPPPPPRRLAPRRPGGRRRPQYDYYDDDDYYYGATAGGTGTGRDADGDDYYEEDRQGRPLRPRQRPRTSPRRPLYDEYEDDRYERRQRRPRPEVADDEYSDRTYERPRVGGRAPGRKPYERRPYDDDRRPYARRPGRDERPSGEERPFRDDRPERPLRDDTPLRDERPLREERPLRDDRPERPLRDDKPLRDENPLREERPERPFKNDNPLKDERPERPLREDSPSNETPLKEDRPFREERPLRDGRPLRMRPVNGDRSLTDERPLRDERLPRDERPLRNERPFRDERPLVDERPLKEERPLRDERPLRENRPFRESGKSFRNKPVRDEKPYDDNPSYDDDDSYRKSEYNPPSGTSDVTMVKPSGGSIFSRPRVAPKIRRPVPTNERDKYDYTKTGGIKPSPVTSKPVANDDYYDDYDVEDTRAPSSSAKTPKISPKPKPEPVDRFIPPRDDTPRRAPFTSISNNFNTRNRKPLPTPKKPVDYADEVLYDDNVSSKTSTSVPRPKPSYVTDREEQTSQKKPKIEEEYYDDYETEKERNKPVASLDIYEDSANQRRRERKENDSTELNKNLKDTIKDIAKDSLVNEEKNRNKTVPVVRVSKRPFLPSRGGSPYLPRGLQPLGGKSFNTTTSSTTTQAPMVTESPQFVNEYKQQPDKSSLQAETQETDYEDDHKNTEPKQTSDERGQYKYHTTDPYGDSKDDIPSKSAEVVTPKQKDEFLYHRQQTQTIDVARGNESPAAVEKIVETKSQQSSYNPVSQILQKAVPRPDISQPYTPTSKPQIPDNISIKQNLADSIENDYDVTLNDALSPTLPNLPPIKSYPSGFIIPSDRDYTFSRFRNNYRQADPSIAASEPSSYQLRQRSVAPGSVDARTQSQRFEGNVHPGVSLRTPQSFYIQQPRYTLNPVSEDVGIQRPRTLVYRHVTLGDFV